MPAAWHKEVWEGVFSHFPHFTLEEGRKARSLWIKISSKKSCSWKDSFTSVLIAEYMKMPFSGQCPDPLGISLFWLIFFFVLVVVVSQLLGFFFFWFLFWQIRKCYLISQLWHAVLGFSQPVTLWLAGFSIPPEGYTVGVPFIFILCLILDFLFLFIFIFREVFFLISFWSNKKSIKAAHVGTGHWLQTKHAVPVSTQGSAHSTDGDWMPPLLRWHARENLCLTTHHSNSNLWPSEGCDNIFRTGMFIFLCLFRWFL